MPIKWSRRTKQTSVVTILAVLTLAAAGALTRYKIDSRPAAQASDPPPPSISVVSEPVVSHDVPIYLRGVGTVIAYSNVVVCSQITGQIVKIVFVEGQTVKKGDLLA
jgi:membrane fusion protein, multidrug efflux system